VRISPNSTTVIQGDTRQFAAVGDAVTWSVSEGSAGGSISSSGLYTAPNSAGTFHVVATSQSDPSVSEAAVVTVTKVQIAALGPFTLTMNQSTQLAGSVFVTGTVNVAVSWSIQEGAAGGTITATGTYTAPTTHGTYHVVVTSQADSTATAVIAIAVVPVTVSISPMSDVLGPSGTRFFWATLNSVNPGVTWSIQEGAAGGTITAAGTYTAPNATGTFHVVATSVFDPTIPTLATVTVVGSGFLPTGDMKDGRSEHTATLLTSGKVLVAGGDSCLVSDGGGCWLQSTELYDPVKGTFARGSQMARSHVSHTATLLPNGKVLIAGGSAGPAELYDPSSDSFSDTGAMVTPRWGHTATLLQNGKVLITGGNGADSSTLSAAELYDPKTGTFTLTGSMKMARTGHTATLLGNGQVLIVGGEDQSHQFTLLSTAELYDPASGSFSSSGSMAVDRAGHSTTLLNNGTVLVAGGLSGISFENTASAEFYDPKSGTFSATSNMTTPRQNAFAVLLQNGKVLIAGGFSIDEDGSSLFTAEVYDPVTGTFTQTGSMIDARALAAVVLLQDGRVLVTGGSDLNTAEVFQ